MEPTNKYTQMQKAQYEREADLMNQTGNHRHHDANKDYWDVLLGDIQKEPAKWKGKKAFDFGCGQGRNIVNMLKLAEWEGVDGGDISQGNLDFAANNIAKEYGTTSKTNLFCLNGTELNGVQSETYDYIMSTIVFQHICVHDIRIGLLKELYRILKPGGLLSFQMGFDRTKRYGVDYYANFLEATATNGICDVCVSDPEQVKQDLLKIGFKNDVIKVLPSFADGHPNWIYIKVTK